MLILHLRSLKPADGHRMASLTNNTSIFHMLTARIIRSVSHRDTGTRLRQFIRVSHCWNNLITFFHMKICLELYTFVAIILYCLHTGPVQFYCGHSHPRAYAHLKQKDALVIITLTKAFTRGTCAVISQYGSRLLE